MIEITEIEEGYLIRSSKDALGTGYRTMAEAEDASKNQKIFGAVDTKECIKIVEFILTCGI